MAHIKSYYVKLIKKSINAEVQQTYLFFGNSYCDVIISLPIDNNSHLTFSLPTIVIRNHLGR